VAERAREAGEPKVAGGKGRARTRRLRVALLAALALVVLAAGVLYTQRSRILALISPGYVGGDPAVAALRLPPGFRANVYASDLVGVRFITFGPDGTLYAAVLGPGQIVAFSGVDAQGRPQRTWVVADGLFDPTSVVYHDGALYVGEQTRVTRLPLGPDGTATGRQVLVDNLPSGGHATRTVLFGPDGGLYVSIGSSCNNCVETDPHRASVWRYNADGSGGRLYARGLRNAVGMTVNPATDEIWVTNMGRDLMGDDTPPETIYALKDGANYGWPRCQAGTIVDPDLGHPGDCDGVERPLIEMQAHSAPLGLAFYTAQQFPARWRGLFVAFHGSWNRTVPTGYKVVHIPLDAAGHVAGPAEDFATGWLQGNDASGRPVGVAVGPGGALYVSDDKANMIYRIAYTG
jgi:glucose/arabinose dehydrogenase